MKKLLGLAFGLAASVSTAAWAQQPRPAARPPAAGSSVTAAAEALTRADEALRADPKNAWAHYNRAAALAALNRVDEALTAYDTAASSFANDKRGRSLALWGKAHLLYRTGRCQEAGQALAAYTKFVGSSDPQATELANHRATTCRPAGETGVAATPSSKIEAETAAVTPPPASKGGEVKVEPGTEVKPASTMPSLAK